MEFIVQKFTLFCLCSNWDSITSYNDQPELVHDVIGDSDEDLFCDDEDDENGECFLCLYHPYLHFNLIQRSPTGVMIIQMKRNGVVSLLQNTWVILMMKIIVILQTEDIVLVRKLYSCVAEAHSTKRLRLAKAHLLG